MTAPAVLINHQGPLEITGRQNSADPAKSYAVRLSTTHDLNQPSDCTQLSEHRISLKNDRPLENIYGNVALSIRQYNR